MESQMKSKSATLDIMKLRLSVQDCGYWLTCLVGELLQEDSLKGKHLK